MSWLKTYFISTLFIFTLFLSACGGGSTDNVDDAINPTPTTGVDVSSFDGTWYGPCFNNDFGYSVTQTLTINGSALISDVISYPAEDCTTPTGTSTTLGEANTTLTHGGTSVITSCKNNQAQQSTLSISSFESSGETFTVEADINNALNLLSGNIDLLPKSTALCIKDNGNLLFAGEEYIGIGPNTAIIPSSTAVNNSNLKWKVESHEYTGSATAAVINNADNFGVLTATTANDTSQGAYSGSNLTIGFTPNGAGVYSIITKDVFTPTRLNNPSLKIMYIDVAVGTGTTTGTTAYTSNSGVAVVFIDSNGKYHFTLDSSITMTKSVDVLGGVDNAPASITFSMSNIHNIQSKKLKKLP